LLRKQLGVRTIRTRVCWAESVSDRKVYAPLGEDKVAGPRGPVPRIGITKLLSLATGDRERR